TIALLVAAGGAASRPDGWWLAAPRPLAAAAVLAALAAVAMLFGAAVGSFLLGVAPVLVLVAAGVRLPGVAALAGPPIAVTVLAGLVAGLAAAAPRPWTRAAFLP